MLESNLNESLMKYDKGELNYEQYMSLKKDVHKRIKELNKE